MSTRGETEPQFAFREKQQEDSAAQRESLILDHEALMLLEAKHLEKETAKLEEAARRHPDNPYILYHLGLAYYLLKMEREAEAMWELAYQYHPKETILADVLSALHRKERLDLDEIHRKHGNYRSTAGHELSPHLEKASHEEKPENPKPEPIVETASQAAEEVAEWKRQREAEAISHHHLHKVFVMAFHFALFLIVVALLFFLFLAFLHAREKRIEYDLAEDRDSLVAHGWDRKMESDSKALSDFSAGSHRNESFLPSGETGS